MSARTEVTVSVLIGAAAAVPTIMATSVPLGLLVGWDLASLVYITWLWTTIRNRDARWTAQRATITDPDRTVTDLLLLSAAVASLVAVGFVLVRAGQTHGVQELIRVGLGLVSVVVSWTIVHTVFTLRYAQLYYAGEDGGIDFNQSDLPTYTDFAYLAFTIGMTFQVSDTPLRSRLSGAPHCGTRCCPTCSAPASLRLRSTWSPASAASSRRLLRVRVT